MAAMLPPNGIRGKSKEIMGIWRRESGRKLAQRYALTERVNVDMIRSSAPVA